MILPLPMNAIIAGGVSGRRNDDRLKKQFAGSSPAVPSGCYFFDPNQNEPINVA